MLNSAKLPKQLWGEAVNTDCYTQNRSIMVKRHRKTAYDVFKGRSPDISYFYVFGYRVHIHNHMDHLGKFDEKSNDGFFLCYSLVAKAFRVFNIRRQEMKEIIHVTFSENDEAISQSSTKGDAINFNENRSIPDDEFLEPRNPLEFTKADNYPALNELDQHESADILKSAKTQDNVIIEPISDIQSSPTTISPLAEVILQNPIPQDRWSREKHIKLVNIIGEHLVEGRYTYYHRFLKLMNDMKRNKHFSEKIASNQKFLNNLQPEWSRHVTIVHQTKDLHTADYTQLYDFLKYNQKEVDELKAKRLAKTQDPLALMANSNNSYAFPTPHQDQSSFNQNYLQQPIPNPEDITDSTTAMNMALALMAKAFKLNYSTPTNNNQRISSNPRNRQIAQLGNPAGYNGVIRNQVNQNAVQNPRVQNVGNQNCLIGVQGNGNQNQIGNGNLVTARAEGIATGQNGNQIRCYNCRGVEEYDLMAAVADLDEIEVVNANCILMANLQQASTSGTQTDSARIYDTDGSAEVHENYYDNEIFNMFTQEEQYTELLEPIYESHQVPQNDNDVISADTSVAQGGEMVEQHPVNFKETRALYESLYQNLAIKVEKVNSVNRKLIETNTDLTTELARFKNQERCFEISQEKYNKLERCYQQSVYQEQCILKKINALHLSFGKQIMTLNEQISELNKQLSKEKSTVSFLLEEKKRLKSDFKTCDDKLLDKQILLEKRIKELNNIKMALGYQNPFYLKQAQKKQQSLYDGKVLLEKHDPHVVYDSEETLQLAQESREKMKQINKEIKPANYTKINHLSGVFVPQKALSREELYFSNNSKTANVSKSFLIPNEDLSDDTTPSVARKFINEVKSTILTLQCVVKQRITIKTHNWASSAHQELHKIEAAKFVGDFKSLAKEVDDSLAKHKVLELEIERLLKTVVSQDIMIIVQNESVVDTSDLQTELEHTKERFENCIIKKETEYAKLWNDWYKKCDECKYDKISYDKAYIDMQQKIKRLQAQLGELKGNLKLLINFIWKFLGTVRFGNDHVAAILGQFCDSDLEVVFRRNACFVKNLKGVDLLKGDRSTNLYIINLHEMASASPICLMARASSTKSWLCHQWLSHLNFDTINDLAINDLVAGLPKFKYHKEHLCPSCEQGKSKRASHTPKLVPNSRQRLHLLHMDLCGPMRIASINGKWYVLVIVDDYSRYTWNDREDIGKLGAKGDIGLFIGYSADSCTYRVYNQRIKKKMETMNVSFDELSAMAFEQRSSKPRLNSMTSGHISSGLDLTYVPSTITTQQPSEAIRLSIRSAAASPSHQNVDPSNMHTFYQPYPHEFQWTKDHPLEQVIGEPSRPVLTRNQL
nr:hypothetical protein [Tanacetum cinerariifolium]